MIFERVGGKNINYLDIIHPWIKGTATRPDVRKNKILEGLKKNNETYKYIHYTYIIAIFSIFFFIYIYINYVIKIDLKKSPDFFFKFTKL